MQVFVKGSTFRLQAGLKEDGAEVDATGYIARASISTADGQTLIALLNVAWTDPVNGIFQLQYTGPTLDWPAGRARIDIEMSDSKGNIAYSTPEFFRIDNPPTTYL